MPQSTVVSAGPRKHRVFVVDDHPIVRQGLALLIDQEPDLVVCGAAEEAHSALRAIASLRPDILILDISLPGSDGIDLLKTIRATDPDIPILVLSMHAESVYAERALRAGANGYIMKQEATDNVLVALRRLLRREVYVSEIGAGMGTRRIAEDLGLSVKTVETYQAHIKDKLGLRTSRDLVQRAIQWRMSEEIG